MIVLGIESSCDETSASVVKDGHILLSNVVFSSMDLHKVYGGVVPEIAARSHIESIIPVIELALENAFPLESTEYETRNDKQILNSKFEKRKTKNEKVTKHETGKMINSFDPWSKIDAIAVTYGAGLGGSLLVGVMTARTLSITKKKPLYAINHVEAHVYANFLTEVSQNPKSEERNNKPCERSVLSQNSITGDSKLETQNWRLGNQVYELPTNQPEFPVLALIVSGGHSQLVLFRDHFDYILLGQTRDDAIGEAFDKVAKVIGLPYPGGPSVAEAAKSGDPLKYKLPKSRLEGTNIALDSLRSSRIAGLDAMQGTNEDAKLDAHSSATREHRSSATQQSAKSRNSGYEFSFSGLKTAVLRLAQEEIGEDFTFPSHQVAERLSRAQKHDIAASFQRVAIETVVDKTVLAYEEFQPRSVVIAGGVAANQELRRQLTERIPIDVQYTDIKLCTDNGAMVATLGCYKAMIGQPTANPYSLKIEPNLSM